MHPCGEDCPHTFSSLRGLNRHRLNCQSYNTRHTGLMESLSTPVHLPSKRLRSSSEVSHQFLQFFPASHISNHSRLPAHPLALPNNPRPRTTWVPALRFCFSSHLKYIDEHSCPPQATLGHPRIQIATRIHGPSYSLKRPPVIPCWVPRAPNPHRELLILINPLHLRLCRLVPGFADYLRGTETRFPVTLLRPMALPPYPPQSVA